MSTPKKSQNVRVIDSNSEETLFECEIDKLQSAYQFAAEMEELGLDVKVIAPSITETLCDTLGIEFDERDEYEESVVAEIDDHDGSCCATPHTFTHDAPDKIQ